MNQNHKKLYLLFGTFGLIVVILIVIILVLTRHSESTPDPDSYEAIQSQSQDDLMSYRDSLLSSDPVFSLLPYDSNPGRAYGFRIFAVSPEAADTAVTLSITIRTCEEPIRTNLRSAALSWLTEQGIDPKNYRLIYDNNCN
ncbi:hypothetical protein IJ095_00840 [Candidatus Saccharibacteria bacterium]|nr:hypothetical protein [Candidatus Saccharibacteria bacterium]